MMPARRSGIAFFLLTLFFSSWYLDQGPNANTVSRAAMVAAVVEQGTLRIDTFATLTDEEIDYYVNHYSPLDKAGAYGAQEWIGYIGVEYIKGSYFNVMGLPIQRLYQELKKL